MVTCACHPANKPFFDHIFALKQNSRNRPNLNKSCTKVLESLSRYPLPLKDAHQISALDGVGGLFCKELESVLKTVLETPRAGRDSSEWRDKRHHVADVFLNAHSVGGGEEEIPDPPSKKARTGVLQPWPSDGSLFQGTLSLPAVKSGAFNLLVSVLLFAGGPLFALHQLPALTEQLRKLVQGCAPANARVLNSLASKGWISADVSGGFRVTETGWQVANRLRVKVPALAYVTAKAATTAATAGRATTSGEAEQPQQRQTAAAVCKLLVCPREVAKGAEFPGEPRPLPLGDFTWVWQTPHGGDERFGGLLVERKSVQDLASSILDGRYDEQKGRIMRMTSVSKVLFVIEEDWMRFKSPVVSPDAVRSAMRSIQLISGFQLITTRSIEHSAQLLQTATDILALHTNKSENFENLPSFAEFAVAARKSADLTVKDVTLRMLLTIPGLGPEAIAGISDVLDATYASGTTLANLRRLLQDFSVETILAMTKESRGMKRAISSKAIDRLKLYL